MVLGAEEILGVGDRVAIAGRGDDDVDLLAGAVSEDDPVLVEMVDIGLRDDLVASIAQLKEQTAPSALVRRGKAAVTGFFVDEYGGVRPERVAMAAGAVVTLVVLRRWRRSRRARRYCMCR